MFWKMFLLGGVSLLALWLLKWLIKSLVLAGVPFVSMIIFLFRKEWKLSSVSCASVLVHVIIAVLSFFALCFMIIVWLYLMHGIFLKNIC